jgi:hypothetical protein
MASAMKDQQRLEPLRRYASIRSGMPDGMPVTALHVGLEQTIVVSGENVASATITTLDIGSRKTAFDYFKHIPLTPSDMEYAIMNVEDEVARAQAKIIKNSTLFTNDAAIGEIARVAGLGNQSVMHFGISEVETTFDRLVSVLHGRPASIEKLPESPEFAATLLILREFMHHMTFASIAVKSPEQL